MRTHSLRAIVARALVDEDEFRAGMLNLVPAEEPLDARYRSKHD